MKGKLIKTNSEDYHMGHYFLNNTDRFAIGSTDYEWCRRVSKPQYKLSLKNCQAIERGYDLDALKKEFIENQLQGLGSEDCEKYIDFAEEDANTFIQGFQKALEILGDKKYSEGDMLECWNSAVRPSNFWSKFMDSLQQTEWDVEVEIDEEMEFIFDPTMGISQGHYLDKPKLDENGCLILKKI